MATTLQPSLLERFRQWWQLRSRTERLLLSLAGIVVLAGIAWLAFWQPMQRETERLTRQLARGRRSADLICVADHASRFAHRWPPRRPVCRKVATGERQRHALERCG